MPPTSPMGPTVGFRLSVGHSVRPPSQAAQDSARAYIREYAHCPQTRRALCNGLQEGRVCYKIPTCRDLRAFRKGLLGCLTRWKSLVRVQCRPLERLYTLATPGNLWDSGGRCVLFPVASRGCRRQLRWILRRLGEVFVGHLRIVLGHNGLTVTDPRADDVHRVGFRQFGLPGATEVLPQLAPRRQPSPLDDLLWLGPQVGIIASIAGDYPFGARFGLLLMGFDKQIR